MHLNQYLQRVETLTYYLPLREHKNELKKRMEEHRTELEKRIEQLRKFWKKLRSGNRQHATIRSLRS